MCLPSLGKTARARYDCIIVDWAVKFSTWCSIIEVSRLYSRVMEAVGHGPFNSILGAMFAIMAFLTLDWQENETA